jgi:hypothetical protein
LISEINNEYECAPSNKFGERGKGENLKGIYKNKKQGSNNIIAHKILKNNFHDNWCHEIRIENILPFDNSLLNTQNPVINNPS